MIKQNTIQIDVKIPEQIFLSIGEELSVFRENVKLYLALFLFQTHKLSLGKSAEFANVSKDYFIDVLDKYKIPLINYPVDDLDKELNRLKEC